VIDVSYNAIKNGLLQTVCDNVLDFIEVSLQLNFAKRYYYGNRFFYVETYSFIVVNIAPSIILNYHHHLLINIPTVEAQTSLKDTNKSNGTMTIMRAQCGLVGANWKSSRDQQFNVPSEARRSSRCLIFGHPNDDRRTLLSFRNRTQSALTVEPSR
jgi:hypothetical protein